MIKKLKDSEYINIIALKVKNHCIFFYNKKLKDSEYINIVALKLKNIIDM